jgi:hypothetical protein
MRRDEQENQVSGYTDDRGGAEKYDMQTCEGKVSGVLRVRGL